MADATEERLHFAWKNFEDQQAIIRAADLKAALQTGAKTLALLVQREDARIFVPVEIG